MPVSFAVAIALFMRRIRGETRLKVYKEKLKKTGMDKAVMYEVPVKRMLLVCFMCGIVLLLHWLTQILPQEVRHQKVPMW